METIRILDAAIALELRTSECYEKLAGIARSEPLRAEFRKLAQEEIVHANTLKTGRQYESMDSGALGRPFVSLETIEDSLERLADLIRGIDAGSVSLKDAVRRLYDLEIEFEKLHLASLFEIRDPGLEKLFKALSAQDAAHRLRLEEILRTPL